MTPAEHLYTAMTSLELEKKISDYLLGVPENRVVELEDLEIFSSPLVASASATDPIFDTYKDPAVIGPHHLTPTEWLPGARTVISYFLPFSERVRSSNSICEGLPSREWVYGRYEGEMANDAVRRFICGEIEKLGGRALVPAFDSGRYGVINRRSTWSERHAAYAAGLGTFSLGRSLITKRGCAGRFGSVITDLALMPDIRPYSTIDAYCNNCGDCIRRCPSGAIQSWGKDSAQCADYQDAYVKPKFLPRYGCGKCQTAVACEAGIP
jgi:epoxyqueuosine reductase QueG